MFVFGNLLLGLGAAIQWALQLYTYVLIGRVIVSWVNADPRNTIVRILYQATEPPLRVIRRWLPMSLRHFPLDVAFIVLFAFVIFARYAVAQTLIQAGLRMQGPRLL